MKTRPFIAPSIGLFLALAGSTLSPWALAQPQPPAAAERAAASDLPLRRITLYRSGVGSFERTGEVSGGANIRLRFRAEQINDILKSMVVIDAKGRVGAVSYGSKEPLGRRLASFGVDLSGSPSMAGILAQLRGAEVIVKAGGETIRGTILGVEQRQEAAGQAQQPLVLPYVNIVTASGVRSVGVHSAVSIELADPQLAAELARALAALSEQRNERVKSVDVSLPGDGTRQVLVHYVHELPVWKTSYRMVLPEEGKDRSLLQAWAIVDNPTDEDWKDVRLSLVSGRPVSFQMDLSQPLYLPRPTVPVPTLPGVISRLYQEGRMSGVGGAFREEGQVDESDMEAGLRSQAELKKEKSRRDRAPAPAAAMESNAMLGRANELAFDADSLAQAVAQSQAQAGEAGEVFRYELQAPVTIARQQSAMLPIASAQVSARRVSIFSQTDGGRNPMRGLWLKNDTDLQLLPGPVSVYDEATYAGDAQIGHVSPKDTRLLAYAVDLDVLVDVEEDSRNMVQKIRLVRGLLEVQRKLVWQTKYELTNKDAARDRTIVIEKAKVPGASLTAPKSPADQTDSLYRFEVAVAAGKNASFTTAQERVDYSQLSFDSFSERDMLSYHQQGQVSEKVLAAFREAQRLRQLVRETEERIARLNAEREQLSQDQARVRENMKVLDRNSPLYAQYVKDFTEQEQRVKEIRDGLKNAQQEQTARQKALEDYLSELSVD